MPESEDAIEARQEREKELVLGKLREMPIVQVACHKAGISRSTFYRWKHEDPPFARACEDAMREGVEFINDLSESQVVALIKKERLPAIALWLKNHHPTYGASVRVASRSLEVNLTPEQEAIVQRALGMRDSINVWPRKRKS